MFQIIVASRGSASDGSPDASSGSPWTVASSIDGAGLEQVMHREDLAQFMVEQLATDQWVRKCVAIGY